MKNKGLLVAALIVAAVAAVGIYGARTFLKPVPPQGFASGPADDAPALPSNLPPLEQSDELVRERAAGLSAEPAFREWLKLESLIARLATAMSMIADGAVPRETFAAFAPRGKFRVVKKEGRVFADPASYARYDAFAGLVSRVDAVAAARLFEELMPLFDAAQRGLGGKTVSARAAFFAASRELLDLPVFEGELPLKEGKKGVGWAYAEDRVENQSPVRKQLMRMGPKNQAAIQAKLRAVVLALGAPGLNP